VKTLILLIKVGLVASSLAAAVFWYLAATAKAKDPGGEASWVGGSFGEKEGMQLIADAALQKKWNTLAASFATVAAILSAADAALSFH
jgi:hypothetical protein